MTRFKLIRLNDSELQGAVIKKMSLTRVKGKVHPVQTYSVG